MQVIKRDGRIKDLDYERIYVAVEKAYKDVYGEDLTCYFPQLEDVNDGVFGVLEGYENEFVGIEEIQDVVVGELMKVNKRVGGAYKEYREERTRVREYESELYKKLGKILNATDIVNSNANVDESSFGGRKFEASGALTKKIALETMIDKEVAKAHLDNRGYIHDLDTYSIGMHNCAFIDMRKLLLDGFSTRNGDVRGANSLSTAFQLIAVAFQVQSQDQFGGVGSVHLDYDLEPFVDKSFRKYIKKGIEYFAEYVGDKTTAVDDKVAVDNLDYCREHFGDTIVNYALKELDKEGTQSAQGLFHNLNTLESRAGSQVPFTSINYGRRDTVAARMVVQWLLNASIDGIGKFHRTSIFPISIFQYKKGINDAEGTPNYKNKKLAIESMTKRIYPNWANCDWSGNIEDNNNPDTVFGTMGCRTLVGYDRHGRGYEKTGRGNVCPYTINLPKIGIKHGICLNERSEADLEGFWNELDEMLRLATKCLVDRFEHICSQSAKSATFMYKNQTMLGGTGDINNKDEIRNVMKHGSLAIGFAGMAETCHALFGKDHSESEEVLNFAESVCKYIKEYCTKVSDKYDLNFGLYYSPCESYVHTAIKGNREVKGLREEFGVIEGVTDREYLTNSIHVPVWQNVDIFEKLRIESRLTKYASSGCITYVELDTSIVNNPEAIEQIIDYAFKELDIPYLAFNFPLDLCLDDGTQGEFNDVCPTCGGSHIEQLRRVTGYLTTDYRKFNKGKQAEVKDRFKHSTITKF